jgi:hypothetical protein
MSKQEKRARLFGRLGLLSSTLSALAVLSALIVMMPKWRSADGMFDLGTVRLPAALGSAGFAFLFGFLGFLGGLEGAAAGEGKIKSLGWVGFWVGVVGAMAGIVLGLCAKFYTL